jgi:hypothetical protein
MEEWMKKLVVAGIALACAVTPVLGAEPTQEGAAPAGQDAAKADSQKMVCKREKTLGSHLSASRVCMTRADWKAREASAQRDRQNISDHAFTSAPPEGR